WRSALGGGGAGAVAGAVRARRQGAARVEEPPPVARTVPADDGLLRAAARPAAEAADAGGTGARQRRPDRVSAVQGGDGSGLLTRQPDRARRGGAGAGRPVPGGAADAGGVEGPADLLVDAVRAAGLLPRRVGQRQGRLEAHRGAGGEGTQDRRRLPGGGAA